MTDTLDTQNATTDFTSLSRSLTEASLASSLLARSLTTAFDQIVVKGKTASDVFGSIALSFANSALKAAFQPMQQGIGNLFGNLFGGAGAAFAKGGMLQAGTPIPFAHGGVIAAPSTFPLAGGRVGIAGERGAEAIMPLARGSDGRLGVAASGTAGANITVNITAGDVESFRRSETQVAALLSRAIAHGQRNL
jgi:phage-related minor tail protein